MAALPERVEPIDLKAHMKQIVRIFALFAASAASLPAATFLEVVFSETGGTAVGTIPASNAPFTVKNPAVEFTSTTPAMQLIGKAVPEPSVPVLASSLSLLGLCNRRS